MCMAPRAPMFPCAHYKLDSAGLRGGNLRNLQSISQPSRLDGSIWHHSVASRPKLFQENAMCRASLAAGRLLTPSLAGRWSARSLPARKPRQSLTGRRDVGSAFGRAPHLRLCVHSVQLDGTSTSLQLMAFQASAAAMGASGHALAASTSEVKANLKSRGTFNPLAFSQSRNFDSLLASLILPRMQAGLSLHHRFHMKGTHNCNWFSLRREHHNA